MMQTWRVRHDSVMMRVMRCHVVAQHGSRGATHDARNCWADRSCGCHWVVEVVNVVNVTTTAAPSAAATASSAGWRCGHPRHQILKAQCGVGKRLHAFHFDRERAVRVSEIGRSEFGSHSCKLSETMRRIQLRPIKLQYNLRMVTQRCSYISTRDLLMKFAQHQNLHSVCFKSHTL